MKTLINYINLMAGRVAVVAMVVASAAFVIGLIKSELALRAQGNLNHAEAICQRHHLLIYKPEKEQASENEYKQILRDYGMESNVCDYNCPGEPKIDNDNYASGWENCYLVDQEWAEVLRTRESEVVAAEEKQAAKERRLIESYRK